MLPHAQLLFEIANMLPPPELQPQKAPVPPVKPLCVITGRPARYRQASRYSLHALACMHALALNRMSCLLAYMLMPDMHADWHDMHAGGMLSRLSAVCSMHALAVPCVQTRMTCMHEAR